MESKLLVVLALCAVIGGTAAIKCYECDRWQIGILNGGESEDECRDPVKEGAPESDDECEVCQTDTREETFAWVERKCVKDKTRCRPGNVKKSFIDILDLSDATEYTVQRNCCMSDLCNLDIFTGDIFTGAAVGMRASYFLFAAVLLLSLALK